MNKLGKGVLMGAVVAFAACTPQGKDNAKNLEITSDADKFSYSLGMDIGKNVKDSDFDSLEVELMVQGLRDVINEGETQFTVEESRQFVREYLTKAQQRAAEANVEAGKEFLAENAKREEVTVLESGLQYEVMKQGNGPKPKATDKVKTHYHGTLIDGTVFDSSVERGQPATFPVNGVIRGWVEALQLMPVGSKWKLYVPSDLAYGQRGSGGAIGPNETLIFEVELLEIIEKG